MITDMKYHVRFGHWAILVATFVAMTATAVQGAGAAAPRADTTAGRGIVELLTGGSSRAAVRVADDLAALFDDGTTRRLLPVIGRGGAQDLKDLVFVRGIDMAILQADVVDSARRQRDLPDGENSFTYIARLHDEEFHLLARADIHSVNDLVRKKVNLGLSGSGSAATAGRLFELLGTSVEAVNERQEVALLKLRRGEIAAMAFVSRKPDPLFDASGENAGLHFIPIPLNPAIIDEYLPTTLTAADYPGLIKGEAPVDTIAVGTLLAVANMLPESERHRNVTAFVEAFFTRLSLV